MTTLDFKKETVSHAAEHMNSRGIENARQEAEWLFDHVFGADRELIITPESEKQALDYTARIASLKNSRRYYELVTRRVEGEPLQYLLGEWEFYGYPMKVGEGVLIPRPETEFLIDLGREHLRVVPVLGEDEQGDIVPVPGEREQKAPTTVPIPEEHEQTPPIVLDLCAGSGCVGIAMCKETAAHAVCVELSERAAYYAKENIALNQLTDKIKLVEGDIFDPEIIESLPEADIIFANPPYLTAKDMQELQREVAHEPDTALYGGEDGLAYYRKIFTLYKKKLRAGGLFAVEVGEGQAGAVCGFMENAGFSPEVQKDYALIERIVYAVNK